MARQIQSQHHKRLAFIGEVVSVAKTSAMHGAKMKVMLAMTAP